MKVYETRLAGVATLVALAAACGTETADPPGTNGGSAGGGTVTGGTTSGTSTGGSATGGTSQGGASTGGTGGLGAAGSGGTQSGSGGATGGLSAGGAGSGGAMSGGMGGSAGKADGGASGSLGGGSGGMPGGAAGSSAAGSGGGTSTGAMPSAGCGKSTGVPMGVNVPNAIVTFPQGYDGSTPVPMLFGFHGAGRTNQNFQEVDARMRNTDLERNFAMVYLKSAGDAWATSDKSRVDTAYTQMTQTYCIDLKRVYATGHSSGAQFIERMLCDGETRLAAIAPVAGSRTCASWPAIPTLFIHGLNDNQRTNDSNGQQELGPFVTSNACSMTSSPYAGAMACNSIYDQAAVNNGCVSYSGCSKPLVFCNHNDQNYSGTNHGWPCFANQTMYTFFTSL